MSTRLITETQTSLSQASDRWHRSGSPKRKPPQGHGLAWPWSHGGGGGWGRLGGRWALGLLALTQTPFSAEATAIRSLTRCLHRGNLLAHLPERVNPPPAEGCGRGGVRMWIFTEKGTGLSASSHPSPCPRPALIPSASTSRVFLGPAVQTDLLPPTSSSLLPSSDFWSICFSVSQCCRHLVSAEFPPVLLVLVGVENPFKCDQLSGLGRKQC